MDYSNNILSVGKKLRGGTITIIGHISSGGFGNTYIVRNNFDEVLAMKEFFMKDINQRERDIVTVSVTANRKTYDSQREKFAKEAKRLRKLNNEHVVRVHDLFDENNTSYYVMDYIDGESLANRLKRTNKALPQNDVIDILQQLLDALSYIHSQGIWHLDIKPANIMVDKSGNVVLVDFGASKQMDSKGSYTATSTMLCYSPHFAPLEQIEQNLAKIGPWTDFYSLGATLYNLLTNTMPPSSSDISAEGKDAFAFNDYVTTDVQQFIIMLMRPSWKERPQDFDGVCELIDFIVEKNNLGDSGEGSGKADISRPRNESIEKESFSQSSSIHNNVSDEKTSYKGNVKRIDKYSASGKTLLKECVYGDFYNNLAIAWRNGYWGIINREGEIVLPFDYSWIESFENGMAEITKYGKKGFVNEMGQVVVHPIFEETRGFFARNVAPVKLDGEWRAINRKGEMILSESYDDVSSYYNDGLIGFEKNGKLGFLDENGNLVIPCRYDSNKLCVFSDGIAAVSINGNWGAIDKAGRVVIRFHYKELHEFSEGGFVAKTKDLIVRTIMGGVTHSKDLFGIVNRYERWIIPPSYNEVCGFSNGLAAVLNGYKWGFMDKGGRWVISAEYDDANSFSEGLAAVKKNGKYGFINVKGENVIPFEYEDANSFSEGLAAVKKDGKYGYINTQGQVICPYNFTYASSFHSGLAIVEGDNSYGCIDKRGRYFLRKYSCH